MASDSGDEEEALGVEPSPLALEIKELKQSLTKALSKRERIPQPTFWYLFHRRIDSMKKRQALKRVLTDVLDP